MTDDGGKDFYDDYWSRTEDQRIYGPMARHTRRLIRSILNGLYYRSVVDVGCGEGTLLRNLFGDRNDLRKVGTDLSPLAVEMAAGKNPGIEFKALDLVNDALSERFDLVICSEVIEHIDEDYAAIRNLAQMTGKYLVITTLGGRMRRHEPDIGHLRNYDPESLKTAVSKAGLKPVRLFQWGWPFFSPLYRDLQASMGHKAHEVTTGSFSLTQKLLSWILFLLFLLNRRYKGDQLVLLAEREQPAPLLSPLDDDPFVSVVIPVRNEEAFMQQCMNSLQQLDYPPDRMEVIFADGRSTDRTVEMARQAGFTVVDNPGLKISSGRNVGFAASKGDIVAFTDADCIFDPQWLRKATRYFRESGIGGLSGPTRVPPDQDAFGKAVGITFDLARMVGTTVHFDNVAAAYEADDLPGCNCFYRRETLDAVMPTNSAIFSNEDVEMNASIRRIGFKLLMTPDVEVFHYKRSSPMRFCKQMHTFAIGRLQLGMRDSSYLRPGHWVAGIGIPIAALLILVAGSLHWEIWAWAVFMMLLPVGALACYGTGKHSRAVGAKVVTALLMLVMGWVSGFLRQMIFPMKQVSPDDQRNKDSN